jgi:hypothetical protein
MIHTPMFFARTPSTFLDKFLALAKDVHTGKADPSKLTAFMKQHPDNAAQFHFLETNNPPASYANCAFYGIHTFRFVDRAGKTTNVRWRFMPEDGEKSLTDAQLAQMPREFLEAAFRDRVKQGPVRWEMIVTIGEPAIPKMIRRFCGRREGAKSRPVHLRSLRLRQIKQRGPIRSTSIPCRWPMVSSRQMTRFCASARPPMPFHTPGARRRFDRRFDD